MSQKIDCWVKCNPEIFSADVVRRDGEKGNLKKERLSAAKREYFEKNL